MKLSSNYLHPGNKSCPREELVFTCTINGANILIWKSIEYIGPNGAELPFPNSDKNGTRKNSTEDPGTYAILTNINNGTGSESEIQLQSDLYISVPN